MSQNTRIIMVNEIPNGPNVVGELFREGQGFAHQPTTALAKGVVEAFDATGFAAGFIHSLVPFGRQNAGIRFEEISVADRPLSVFRGERIP